jgi:drug/metabolite transporter (DMT)-like permease
MIPISAMIMGAQILDEIITSRQLGGIALIALGLAVIDGRLPALVVRRR